MNVGSRLCSCVCSTEVIVVRSPVDLVRIECGGAPMVPAGTDVPATGQLDHALAQGTQLGKRYRTEDGTVEVICTKEGKGSLTIGGVVLSVAPPKQLPSAD